MRLLFLCIVMSWFPGPVLSADAPKASELAGVYKHRFKSASIAMGKAPGEADTPYQAEDVIEIVAQGEDKLYFRIHLDFYNGHSCTASGIAHQEAGKFTYRDPESYGGDRCTLTLEEKDGDLFITDRNGPKGLPTCRNNCGARGSLSDYKISMTQKRPIKYMKRLLESRQYKTALEEDKKNTN